MGGIRNPQFEFRIPESLLICARSLSAEAATSPEKIKKIYIFSRPWVTNCGYARQARFARAKVLFRPSMEGINFGFMISDFGI